MIQFRLILNIISALLLFLALALLLPAVIAFFYDEGDFYSLAFTLVLSFLLGLTGYFSTRSKNELKIKDGFLIVTLSWILFALIGALPFYISDCIPSYTDAFFETMSGFTTTGASILTDIEKLPHGLLFWRSFTHWLGGMGIILLSLAILPLLGVGGMQLFKAEVPGPVPDRLTPRIRHTAELLWGVYVIISIVEMILLKTAGMNWFDAACHTFGTMATGGFSTKNLSIAHYQNPWIDWIIIIFMIIAGTNFALHYRALKGKPIFYWRDSEARFFITIILIASLIIGFDVWKNSGNNMFKSLTDTIFQVVSILTTTGYGTSDYEAWAYSSRLILFILMFIGGCAGSTAGGMKIVRSMVLFQFSRQEMKKLIHPQAVFTIRIGGTIVPDEIQRHISGFFLLYISVFVISIIVMSILGLDFESSFGSVAATLNNIGPGLGSVGPTENYAHIPLLGKWFLSALMLIGRLELYTVLVLFSFTFWKK